MQTVYRLLESHESQTEQHSSLAELFEPSNWKVISKDDNQVGLMLSFFPWVTSAFSVWCFGWLIFISVIHACRCHIYVFLNFDKAKHLFTSSLYYGKKYCIILCTTQTIGSSFLWSRWKTLHPYQQGNCWFKKNMWIVAELMSVWKNTDLGKLGNGTKERTV